MGECLASEIFITAYVWDRVFRKKVQGEVVKVNFDNWEREARRIKRELEVLVRGNMG